MEPTVYREMYDGEEAAVCALVEYVFNALVAPEYGREGIEEFFRFASPGAMAGRVRSGGFVLLASQAQNLVGMLEFAPPDRIALLFVSVRRQGIARELLVRAVNRAKSENATLSKINVHSSPYAQAAYRRMGFHPSGKVTTAHGIRYIPMELIVANARG